jgi:hypothetical protein
VKECLVMPNLISCCFGHELRSCDFIAVRSDTGMTSRKNQPVRFEGNLQVGDVFADGAWRALYALKSATVAPPDRVAWK